MGDMVPVGEMGMIAWAGQPPSPISGSFISTLGIRGWGSRVGRRGPDDVGPIRLAVAATFDPCPSLANTTLATAGWEALEMGCTPPEVVLKEKSSCQKPIFRKQYVPCTWLFF